MASAATRSPAPPTEREPGPDPDRPSADSAIERLIGAVGRDVASRWLRDADGCGDDARTATAVETLTEAILGGLRGAPTPSLVHHGWTADAPQLITELRRGLLTGSNCRDVPVEDLLHALRVLESLLEAAEEDIATRFVQHLIGPSALDLLVEIAHDVRSPLGSILFLVERMRRGGTGPVSPMQERHLGLVYSAAFGLSALASDMIELAHGGARLIGAAPVPFSLSELLHAVRDVVQPIAEEKGLAVRFSAPRSDVRVGHPAAITRVLLNLVTNALKFTNNGSVSVAALAEADGVVRFCVEDTGRGMPPSVMARITEVFDRSNGARAHGFSSAGLGIAICRKLLHTMGGTLVIVPVSPVGTRVDFALVLPEPPQ